MMALAVALLALAGNPETARVTAEIHDASGAAVSGAALYAYRSANTRQPAEFISARSGRDGKCSLGLPPGRYWVVARQRTKDQYGPLMLGDRHSGAPVVLDVSAGETASLELVVMDLREATRARPPTASHVLLEGSVLAQGTPLPGHYVFAWKDGVPRLGVPDFISPWTGADGRYRLHVPPGRYHLGVSARFPPPADAPLLREAEVTADSAGVDLVLPAAQGD